MIKRNAYLLSTNFESERTIYSKNLLEKIGFNVILFKAIKHNCKVTSNKISMQAIYETICNDKTSDWNYVFEDDIDILSEISLSEIIEYEKISDKIIYLGLCRYGSDNFLTKTKNIINKHQIYKTFGNTRGLHAIGLSHTGFEELLEFSKNNNHKYMDCILEEFTKINPATIIRYDLESYIPGHRGIFYQDRKKFPTTI